MSADWRAQLAPALAPAAPGWWPPAPGWWTLAVLGVVGLGYLIRAWRHPTRIRRRAALRELRAIRAAVTDPLLAARALESLLRRFAIAQFGRDRMAALTGARWLGFVAEVSGGRLAPREATRLLESAFGDRVPDDGPATRAHWIGAAEAFIRRAARGRPPELPQ
jgi:hypothetical protein